MRKSPSLHRQYLWLFLVAFAVRLLIAAFIPEPGYMDTAYYTIQGIRLAEGDGATEPYLWHYLDAPDSLPHPAFGYWMPIPSLLVAPSWAVSHTFFAAQIPFALLSAFLVVLGAHIAWKTTERRRHFWAVGMLLMFSAYFFPFWTLPETFAPFAFFGALCLWAGGQYWENQLTSKRIRWIVIAAGTSVLAYLTRSDGLLLVGLALFLPVLRRDWRAIVIAGCVTLVCFAPWITYNVTLRGTPLPTGGTQTLWLTDYDDIFCYHCDLSLQTYLDWGWRAIAKSKFDALSWNLRTLLAVVGFIFLWPFTIFGGWRLRKSSVFVLAWCYLLLLFGAMTFGFSFPGPRGGFFHSAGALLPYIVTAGIIGIDRVIIWVGRRRGWNISQAQTVFTWGFVLLAVVMSGMAASPKLKDWRQANALYREVDAWITLNSSDICPVLVGNPPNFWYATHIPALMAPNEDIATITEVAQRYEACWLLLDAHHPKPLAEFYATDQSEDWVLATQWDAGKLYKRIRLDTK